MRHNKRGFTLVELNIAILFVAMLILGVAMTTMYVTRIYQKGVTVKTVNQVGREVMGQLQRDIATARPSQVAHETVANSGRLCLGNASYVYNTAEALAAGSSDVIRFNGSPVVLVRVNDVNAEWCERAGTAFVKGEVTNADQPTELLANDVIPLAVHQVDFVSYTPEEADGLTRALYRLDLQLGTNETGTVDGGSCRPPSDGQANFDACFVVEFSTIIRAGEITQ